MTEVQQLIERLADADLPVLITGESGTGRNWSRGRSMRRHSAATSRWSK